MTDTTVNAAEKSGAAFMQKVKDVFVKNESLVEKEIAKLSEAGKKIPAGLKAGNIRWGNTIGFGLAGLGGLAVLASVVASTGNKGPGKFAEQETARQEQAPAAGVGVA